MGGNQDVFVHIVQAVRSFQCDGDGEHGVPALVVWRNYAEVRSKVCHSGN